MALLVMLLCLYSEYGLIHQISVKREAHLHLYIQKTLDLLPKKITQISPWLLVFILPLPLMGATFLLLWMMQQVLYGLVVFILQLIIFLYALGPKNPFYAGNESAAEYLVSLNYRLFTIMWIYIIFGPLGILFYRIIDLMRQQHELKSEACLLFTLLNYIPIRLSACLLMLAGDFQNGITAFKPYVFAKPSVNDELLKQVAIRVAKVPDISQNQVIHAETLGLHATIINLVFLALGSLIWG